MSSVSSEQLTIIRKSIANVAKGSKVVAACIYGSRVAGYARRDSDIDVLVVLDEYPYAIKYVYLRESGIDISALVVSKRSLESDAQRTSLGEFAVGRLLHIFEPILNAGFLYQIERLYKRRIILEELQNIVEYAGVLSTDILFPLEYVVFAKIKHRMSVYPSAAYSYYKTYSACSRSEQNLNFALVGYRGALDDILAMDSSLLLKHIDLLQISDKRVTVERGRTRLRLTKRLQEFSSYLVHTYAGRKIMHLALKETKSKIRRHAGVRMELPEFMDSPKKIFWRLAEGKLILDSKDWLQDLAGSKGITDYSVIQKRRLGNVNSRTVLYVVRHDSREYKIAIKDLARSKSVKWAALNLWTAPVKRFKVDPLLRLGSEYRAIRHVRTLGLLTPQIEAVVLDRRILVTRFIEGDSLGGVIAAFASGQTNNVHWIHEAGKQIARVHNAGASFGNIKPKNLLVSRNNLWFTDLEQFVFDPRDQVWDIAQFLSWGLKGARRGAVAARITREFLQGYVEISQNRSNLSTLSKKRRYMDSFFPVLAPSVARSIKKELQAIAA
jgi:tRNA A-37 threonylcarbamoyl transferase component Bud32/predicted nucleotidyltransferase